MIGDCVNTASRLEGVTKDLSVTLLVSETVVRELAETNEYVFDSLDEVSVKGKAQKVQVFGVAERL